MLAPPSRSETPAERRLALAVLCVSLGVGAALRVGWALSEDGLYWPDEIYQSLEPAHRLVFGYGMRAWEFIDGARNWALPALVAALFKLSTWVGLDGPRGYLGVTRCAFGLMGVGAAWGSGRLARAYGASALAAATGAALLALGAVPVYFGPRAMSENASALPAVLGLGLALAPGASRRAVWVGASLLGLAVLLRLQSGIFCVGLLGTLAARREWRSAREALGVLALWALLFGLLDWLTWGRWFHSALVYLDFNLVQGRAAGFGTAPFAYYSRVLGRSMGTLSTLALVLSLLAARRAPGLFLTAAAFYVLHGVQPHKELRFLVPVLPLFAALAGVGLDTLLRYLPPSPARLVLPLLVVGVGAASALRVGRLTFWDIGQYEQLKPQQSAWDDLGPLNRLLLLAGQQPDLCGLKVEASHLAWTGGYSYLHRDVPLYPHTGPDRGAGVYNYVLTSPGASGSGTVVAAEGPFALVRLRPPPCRPDPTWSSRLP
jgi:GPI mannosyltransferase 3